jgi:hypothetical protein
MRNETYRNLILSLFVMVASYSAAIGATGIKEHPAISISLTPSASCPGCEYVAIEVSPSGEGTLSTSSITKRGVVRTFGFTLSGDRQSNFVSKLERFRPEGRYDTGTAGCSVELTDADFIQVKWRTESTSSELRHYFGCDPDKHETMNVILRQTVEQLKQKAM